MKHFLMAKHWQLFFLIVGLPMVFDFFEMHSIQTVTIFISSAVLFTWLFSIEYELSKILKRVTDRKSVVFRVTFFLVIIYFSVLLILIISEASFESIYWLVFHTICFVLVLKLFYHCAKLIRQAELIRELESSEIFTYFILMWFFPVGVWVLQPKLNKIIQDIKQNY